MRTTGNDALELRMFTADMIEHPIKNDTQPAVVGRRDECIEIRLVAESPVDLEMINRVVTMGGRGEDWPKQNPAGAEIHSIIQPRDEMTKSMHDTGDRARLALGSNEAERVDLPPYRPFDPVPHVISLEAVYESGRSPPWTNQSPTAPAVNKMAIAQIDELRCILISAWCGEGWRP